MLIGGTGGPNQSLDPGGGAGGKHTQNKRKAMCLFFKDRAQLRVAGDLGEEAEMGSPARSLESESTGEKECKGLRSQFDDRSTPEVPRDLGESAHAHHSLTYWHRSR